MKKLLPFAAALLLSGASLFSFTGCELLADWLIDSLNSDDNTTTGTTTAENSETWAYTSDSPVYKVSSSTSSITITGLSKGQHIYISKTNPTSSSISSSKTQYVSAASNMSLSDAEDDSSSSSSGGNFPGSGGWFGGGFNHFQPQLPETKKLSSAARAVGTTVTSGEYVDQLDITSSSIGTLTKQVYIDCDTDVSTFHEATATLRAVGKYCYIWVVNGYYSGDDKGTYKYSDVTYSSKDSTTYYKIKSSDQQVTDDIITKYQETFDEIYPMVRNVFGEESDEIFYNGTYYGMQGFGFNSTDMKYLSDTGYMVNIVLYDIGNDYGYSSSQASGILGYFYAKDYFPNNDHVTTLVTNCPDTGYTSTGYDVYGYSNEGKYFYLDSVYSVSDEGIVLSTLAHEFQHMIDWNTKTMTNSLSSGSWYNEMKSQLCEDIMQSYLEENLGNTDDDGPLGRIPYAQKLYVNAGLETLGSSSGYSYLSCYGTNYMFGAWLIRQFGGVPLIHEMSTNAYVDINSVVKAVNTVNGTSYTIEDLLKMYTQACIYSSSLDDYEAPTFNQSLELSSTSSFYYKDSTLSYGYPLEAIDLWNLSDYFSEDYLETYDDEDYYSYTGPELYGYNAKYTLRPYGMLLVDVGTVSSTASVSITFGNSSISSSEKLYIIVE